MMTTTTTMMLYDDIVDFSSTYGNEKSMLCIDGNKFLMCKTDKIRLFLTVLTILFDRLIQTIDYYGLLSAPPTYYWGRNYKFS